MEFPRAGIVSHQGRSDIASVVSEQNRQESRSGKNVEPGNPEVLYADSKQPGVSRQNLHQADSTRSRERVRLEGALALDHGLHQRWRDRPHG